MIPDFSERSMQLQEKLKKFMDDFSRAGGRGPLGKIKALSRIESRAP